MWNFSVPRRKYLPALVTRGGVGPPVPAARAESRSASSGRTGEDADSGFTVRGGQGVMMEWPKPRLPDAGVNNRFLEELQS